MTRIKLHQNKIIQLMCSEQFSHKKQPQDALNVFRVIWMIVSFFFSPRIFCSVIYKLMRIFDTFVLYFKLEHFAKTSSDFYDLLK